MTKLSICAALCAAGLLAGCQQQGNNPHAGHGMGHGAGGGTVAHHENMWEKVHDAVAVVTPASGSNVRGTVHFRDVSGGVQVTGEITGLEPNSTHAFHVHQYGDASDPKGASAGGHYNPEGKHHGGPDSAEHHAGDLGNIQADGSGRAAINVTIKGISVAGLKDPIIGRSVVVHAKADDLKSDPAGNAGDRVGVGVIGVAKGE